jgi:hypothetical protein
MPCHSDFYDHGCEHRGFVKTVNFMATCEYIISSMRNLIMELFNIPLVSLGSK